MAVRLPLGAAVEGSTPTADLPQATALQYEPGKSAVESVEGGAIRLYSGGGGRDWLLTLFLAAVLAALAAQGRFNGAHPCTSPWQSGF